MGDFNNQRWLADLLHRVGMDSKWEVDVLEGEDGTLYLVNVGQRIVVGEVTTQAEVIRYGTPRDLGSIKIKEAEDA